MDFIRALSTFIFGIILSIGGGALVQNYDFSVVIAVCYIGAIIIYYLSNILVLITKKSSEQEAVHKSNHFNKLY
jgi:hypothetical protein